MSPYYKLCDVLIGEATRSVWVPRLLARVRRRVFVKKEGAVIPENAIGYRIPDFWDAGVVASVAPEMIAAATLTDDDKAQVFEE